MLEIKVRIDDFLFFESLEIFIQIRNLDLRLLSSNKQC